MDRSTDFGTLTLATQSILESYVLGMALTNRTSDEAIRKLDKRHHKALVDYLNTGDNASREFLELCNSHIQDISNHNLTFLDSYK